MIPYCLILAFSDWLEKFRLSFCCFCLKCPVTTRIVEQHQCLHSTPDLKTGSMLFTNDPELKYNVGASHKRFLLLYIIEPGQPWFAIEERTIDDRVIHVTVMIRYVLTWSLAGGCSPQRWDCAWADVVFGWAGRRVGLVSAGGTSRKWG